MKMKFGALLGSFVLVLTMMMSCKSAVNQPVISLADLDGEWSVVTFNGTAPSSENPLSVGINAVTERLFGYAGCNRIMGQVEYPNSKKNNIRFINVVTTRKACPDMATEQLFLETLSNISRFEVDGATNPIDKITLFDMKGKPVIKLQRR